MYCMFEYSCMSGNKQQQHHHINPNPNLALGTKMARDSPGQMYVLQFEIAISAWGLEAEMLNISL